MNRKPWHRTVTVQKTQRQEYSVIYGIGDKGVAFAQVVGKGSNPIEAMANAMLTRCDHTLVRRMVEDLHIRLTPSAERASTRVDKLDAELAGVDAGIASSRAAARARRDAEADGA